jgi:hypothetical protein
MAVEASGTTTPTTDAVEQTLNGASFTGDKKYLLCITLKNLTGVEVFRIRVYRKVLTGGSEEIVWAPEWEGDQGDEDVIIIGPIYSPFSCSFRITQTGGTLRAYDWSVESL